MSEKRTDFWTLSEAVIAALKSLEDMDSSLTNYRRLYARLGSFLKDHSIKEYSPAVGKAFIDEYYPCDTHRKRMVLLMIRRLDDHLNSIPYRCHRVMKTPDILPAFESVLHDYQEYCGSIGNKPGTINVKKRFCLMFLQFLLDFGCNDISGITAEIVSKSCLIYTNKDGYAALRQFLRYLFEKGSITKDLSTIVPHYKRRQIIPNVFTPEEIKRIEGTITPDTPMGKRNLAILLLITRMGLRSGDIAELQLSSIDFISNHIDLIQQKTGEPLSVFMPDDVSFALKSHI